jgi:hypothetical protein
MNNPFSFDPSSFDSSSLIAEIMKNLHRGQSAIITPTEAGSSSSAKNRFIVRVAESEDQLIDLAKFVSQYTLPVSWEYLYKSGPQETMLPSLGDEGWELCAITPRSDGELWIFKRAKLAKGG